MIKNEYHLINKIETEYTPPIEEMGQVIIDRQRINRLKTLTYPLKLNLENRRLITNRIATLAFQRNINYSSLMTLAEKLNLSTDEVTEVYMDFEGTQGLFFIKDMISNPKKEVGVTKKQLEIIENKISTLFLTANMSSYPTAELGNKTDCVLIPSEGKVVKCSYRDDDKTQLVSQEVMLNICPANVVCHIDREDEFNRRYDWVFIAQQNHEEMVLNNMDIKTTAKKINEAGYSTNDRDTKNTLSNCLNALSNYVDVDEKCYIEKIRLVPRGFAYDDKRKQVVMENYHLIESEPSDIRDALLLLNDYINDMSTENEQLFCVTNFKWGLYAPFIYASKQMVKGVFDVESPYLQGVGGTGKTTGHGHMVLCMWYDNINDGLIQGTEIDTFPQFSYTIERDTLPLVFDEGGGNFEDEYNIKWLNRLKSALNSINWRHTRDKDGHIFESRNPFMITSNGQIHDPENAVTRRLFIEQFTYEEDKTAEMEEYFLRKYKTGTDNNELFRLKHISHTFARHILENPQLLGSDYDWKQIVNDFIYTLYLHYNIQPHPKILQWVNVIEEGIVSERYREHDRIKEAIKKRIIDTKRYVAKDIESPYTYLKPVISNMAGIEYVTRGESATIRITKPFLSSLYKSRDVGKDYTLKDASVRLSKFGFKMGRNSESRYIYTTVPKFIEWLYPEEVNLE